MKYFTTFDSTFFILLALLGVTFFCFQIAITFSVILKDEVACTKYMDGWEKYHTCVLIVALLTGLNFDVEGTTTMLTWLAPICYLLFLIKMLFRAWRTKLREPKIVRTGSKILL